MKKYNLYLDESQSSGQLPYFCLAGCIIQQGDAYSDLVEKVNKLKFEVIDSDKCMHEREIRDKKDGFEALRNKDKNEEFWTRIRKIFEQTELNTICSAINCCEYKSVYHSCEANDSYQVTLQIIMENFAYFLSQNDATGMIYLEKTNDLDATRLRNHYQHIMITGTLYLSPTELQRRLVNINFLTKEDNNVGLQLADFLPNAFNRRLSNLSDKQPSLFDVLESKLYDGGIGEIERFGRRVLLCNNP